MTTKEKWNHASEVDQGPSFCSLQQSPWAIPRLICQNKQVENQHWGWTVIANKPMENSQGKLEQGQR